MNGKVRPSLRLFDFLRKDGRFGPRYAQKNYLKDKSFITLTTMIVIVQIIGCI